MLRTGNFTCVTGELPWRDNTPNKSCIPAGEYECHPWSSAKYPKAYEVRGVPNRSAILIHQGNFCGDVDKGLPSNVEGCILVGESVGTLNGHKAVMNSKETLDKLVDVIGTEPFTLTISWG